MTSYGDTDWYFFSKLNVLFLITDVGGSVIQRTILPLLHPQNVPLKRSLASEQRMNITLRNKTFVICYICPTSNKGIAVAFIFTEVETESVHKGYFNCSKWTIQQATNVLSTLLSFPAPPTFRTRRSLFLLLLSFASKTRVHYVYVINLDKLWVDIQLSHYTPVGKSHCISMMVTVRLTRR